MRDPLMHSSFSEERLLELVCRYDEMVYDGKSAYFDIDELEELIDHHLILNDYDEANQVIEYGLSIHDNHPTLMGRKAKLLIYQGECQEALNILESIAIKEAEHLSIEAEAYLAKGDIIKARTLFIEFINLHPNKDQVFLCHDIALYLNNNCAHESAIIILENGLKIYPEQLDLLQEQAYSYEQLGELDKAIELYNLLLDKDPFKFSAWFLLGSLYYNNNNYRDALEAFDFAIAIEPDNEIGWLQKGHCLFYLDLFKDAIVAYEFYLARHENDSNVKLFLAECYENLEEYEIALEHYKASYALDELSADAILGCSICCFVLHKLDLAKYYIDIANKLLPHNAEVLSYKGDIYSQIGIEQKDSEIHLKALHAYKESIALDNTQVKVHIAIANFYLVLEKYKVAKKYFEYAYELEPNLELIPMFLAAVNYHLEDYESMNKYLLIAQEMDSNNIVEFLKKYPDAEQYI